jgi:hypothetical protein
MENFRCFEDTSVEFCVPRESSDPSALDNVTLLLGSNGSGKTSILRAICLAAIGDLLPLAGYAPRMLIRRDALGAMPGPGVLFGKYSYDKQDITKGPDFELIERGAEYVNEARIEPAGDYERLEFNPGRRLDYWKDESLACLLLAYGVTRRTNSSGYFDSDPVRRKGPRYHRVAGLFEEYVPLVYFEDWTQGIETLPRRWTQMQEIMGQIFPESIRFVLPAMGGGSRGRPYYLCNGVPLSRTALSDGYKLLVGLVSDILFQIHEAMGAYCRDFSTLSGIVLIDDVDLLMHPLWQRSVLPRIARAFPRLQFIVTTHSPLVAGSLHRGSVRVVDVGEGGAPQIRAYREPLHGLSADQILTSSYFGLDSPRSEDAERILRRLGEEVAVTRDPKLAIDFLRLLRLGQEGEEVEPS